MPLNLRWSCACRLAEVLATLVLAASTLAQGSDTYPKVHGVYEEYGIALTKGGAFQAKERARWLSTEVEMSPTFRAVLGYFNATLSSFEMLDENYVELGEGSTIKFGRFRPKYGTTTWADEWYTGFIFAPLIHFPPTFGTTRLERYDTGLAVHGGTPELEYDVAWVDTATTPFQLTPDRMDHVVARLQTFKFGAVLGANAMIGPRGLGDGEKSYGLDIRWTFPQWQVWAEQDWAHGLAADSSGYFVNVFFNPFNLPHTTFLARVQDFAVGGAKPDKWNLVTVGAKQVFNSTMTGHLNYTFGPDAARLSQGQGWSIQVLATFKF